MTEVVRNCSTTAVPRILPCVNRRQTPPLWSISMRAWRRRAPWLMMGCAGLICCRRI